MLRWRRARGWARLRERASALAVARARAALSGASGLWGPADRALFIAVAEALGYGRDRDALRRCGERLAGGAEPDALAAEVRRLGAVERRRVAGMLTLRERWLVAGPLAGAARRAASLARPARARWEPRRALVEELAAPGKGVSLARAGADHRRQRGAAVSVARCAGQNGVDRGAQWDLVVEVIERFPGLPSNQITRVMTEQLGLARAPVGALMQQGLHHIWERHCREKRCGGCPCALRAAPGGPAP